MFRFSQDARKFFNRIGVSASQQKGKSTSGQFQTMFDAYWLCCQLGMKSGPDGYRKSEKQQPEITPRFVGASKTHRALISGVGFYYHCSRKGFTDVNDQVLVEMEKFFSEVPGELGNSGYDLFNAYSNGGFEILYESMGDHTEELSEFLSEYVELMGYS